MGVMAPAAAAPGARSVPGSVLVYVGLGPVGDGPIELTFPRALRNAIPRTRTAWLVRRLADEVIGEAGVVEHRRDLPGRRGGTGQEATPEQTFDDRGPPRHGAVGRAAYSEGEVRC